MSSTTTSMSGSVTSPAGSAVKSSVGTWGSRARESSRTAMPAHLEVRPALDDQVGGPILQDTDEGGTDVAAPEHGDAHDLFGR